MHRNVLGESVPGGGTFCCWRGSQLPPKNRGVSDSIPNDGLHSTFLGILESLPSHGLPPGAASWRFSDSQRVRGGFATFKRDTGALRCVRFQQRGGRGDNYSRRARLTVGGGQLSKPKKQGKPLWLRLQLIFRGRVPARAGGRRVTSVNNDTHKDLRRMSSSVWFSGQQNGVVWVWYVGGLAAMKLVPRRSPDSACGGRDSSWKNVRTACEDSTGQPVRWEGDVPKHFWASKRNGRVCSRLSKHCPAVRLTIGTRLAACGRQIHLGRQPVDDFGPHSRQ